jgi:hypothetical protein
MLERPQLLLWPFEHNNASNAVLILIRKSVAGIAQRNQFTDRVFIPGNRERRFGAHDGEHLAALNSLYEEPVGFDAYDSVLFVEYGHCG